MSLCRIQLRLKHAVNSGIWIADWWLVYAHIYSFVSIRCAVYFDFYALMILFPNKNIYFFSNDFRVSWTHHNIVATKIKEAICFCSPFMESVTSIKSSAHKRWAMMVSPLQTPTSLHRYSSRSAKYLQNKRSLTFPPWFTPILNIYSRVFMLVVEMYNSIISRHSDLYC